MSVLIKKMEMPKGCWACPFAVGKHYECLFTKKSSNWGLTTRPSDCPLIEVKSPHGRLIDADALNKKMEERIDRLKDNRSMYEASCVATALDLFALTIIEAEGSENEAD